MTSKTNFRPLPTQLMNSKYITKNQADAITRRFLDRIETNFETLFNDAPDRFYGLDEIATQAMSSALGADLRKVAAAALSESIKGLEDIR